MHLFHILVPLKLLGEYHLVLAICYNPCYWFVLHKNIGMIALHQTKGLSTSVSFLANTRCLGKIIMKKGVMVVPPIFPLAFNHLWFRDCWKLNCLFILKHLMIFSSATLIQVEEKAGLAFHSCKTPWQRVLYNNCMLFTTNQMLLFCFMFLLLARKLIPFSACSLSLKALIKLMDFHFIHSWLSFFQAEVL